MKNLDDSDTEIVSEALAKRNKMDYSNMKNTKEGLTSGNIDDHDSGKFKTERLTKDNDYGMAAPVDKSGVVKLIFFTFGVGVLLAFNCCLNCLDFFINKVSVKLS